MPTLLLWISGAICVVWGAAHIAPTKGVVQGYGEISRDNKLIITMEWIAEGLALIFVGVLIFLAAFFDPGTTSFSTVVLLSCAVMLLIMATLTALTGGRSNVIPIKICPIVKTVAAALILIFLFIH